MFNYKVIYKLELVLKVEKPYQKTLFKKLNEFIIFLKDYIELIDSNFNKIVIGEGSFVDVDEVNMTIDQIGQKMKMLLSDHKEQFKEVL